MVSRFRTEDERGVTLVELLVTILIVAVLSAAATSYYLQHRRKGWMAQVVAATKNLASVQEYWINTDGTGAYAADLSALVDSGFNYSEDDVAPAVVTATSQSFCLEVESRHDDSIVWHYNSAVGRPERGAADDACAQGTLVATAQNDGGTAQPNPGVEEAAAMNGGGGGSSGTSQDTGGGSSSSSSGSPGDSSSSGGDGSGSEGSGDSTGGGGSGSGGSSSADDGSGTGGAGTGGTGGSLVTCQDPATTTSTGDGKPGNSTTNENDNDDTGGDTTGDSSSDPDGTENDGVDKDGGTGGEDQTDQDGNNGSGNDADSEDDNKGRDWDGSSTTTGCGAY